MEGKTDTRKIEDILQEELLQERAYVLGRAGQKVAHALARLQEAAAAIDALYTQQGVEPLGDEQEITPRYQLLRELNEQIGRYNELREEAKLMFYYLIVTREAIGIRRHHFVEEAYRIPPRKQLVQE